MEKKRKDIAKEEICYSRSLKVSNDLGYTNLVRKELESGGNQVGERGYSNGRRNKKYIEGIFFDILKRFDIPDRRRCQIPICGDLGCFQNKVVDGKS